MADPASPDLKEVRPIQRSELGGLQARAAAAAERPGPLQVRTADGADHEIKFLTAEERISGDIAPGCEAIRLAELGRMEGLLGFLEGRLANLDPAAQRAELIRMKGALEAGFQYLAQPLPIQEVQRLASETPNSKFDNAAQRTLADLKVDLGLVNSLLAANPEEGRGHETLISPLKQKVAEATGRVAMVQKADEAPGPRQALQVMAGEGEKPSPVGRGIGSEDEVMRQMLGGQGFRAGVEKRIADLKQRIAAAEAGKPLNPGDDEYLSQMEQSLVRREARLAAQPGQPAAPGSEGQSS